MKIEYRDTDTDEHIITSTEGDVPRVGDNIHLGGTTPAKLYYVAEVYWWVSEFITRPCVYLKKTKRPPDDFIKSMV